MFSYWREHPPLHVLLGACLLKPASSPAASADQIAQLKQTVAAFGGSIGNKLPGAYRSNETPRA